MVLVENWPFFRLFFQDNIGQENVFYDFLERNNAFVGYKNTKLKKSKKRRFFQSGQSMVLVKKWPFFHLFFKDNIALENVFYDILERKTGFLGYKNTKLKKSKNLHFCKGVSPWFWFKICYFSIFFLKIMQGKKMCFMLFQNEETPFQAIKTGS